MPMRITVHLTHSPRTLHLEKNSSSVCICVYCESLLYPQTVQPNWMDLGSVIWYDNFSKEDFCGRIVKD